MRIAVPIALAILFAFLLTPIVSLLERTPLRRTGAIVLSLGLIVTGLGYNISNLTGSKRLLTATAAFRNEPY